MNFEINGRNVELKFGTGFIRRLDEIYKADQHGLKFGVGLMIASVQLEQLNPATLVDIIMCAAKGKPSVREVENAIDNYAEENGGLKNLFDEVTDTMGKSYVLKDTYQGFQTPKDEESQENES